MILKYRTVRDDEICQWNYIDGIREASTFVDVTDKKNPCPMVRIVKDDLCDMCIALHNEAYLLNDYGTTIEKIRM
jgi:hypothetical protein